MAIMIFLGAGASAYFGIPTTKEYPSRFKSRLEKEDEEDAQLVNEIENNLKDYPLPLDQEVLMTVLEDLAKEERELLTSLSPYTSFFLSKVKDKEYYLKNSELKSKANRLILKFIQTVREDCIIPLKNKKQEIIEVYSKFLNSICDKGIPSYSRKWEDREVKVPASLRIFTTNYDTCLETFFTHFGIGYNRGLRSKGSYQILDVSSYRGNLNIVDIVKIHGSIDLFRTVDGEIIYHPGPKINREDIKKEITLVGKEIKDEFIIYPTEASGYRHISESPFLEMLNNFKERVCSTSTTHWFFVGHSFRDRTILSICEGALSNMDYDIKANLKVYLIDPCAKDIIKSVISKGFAGLGEKLIPIEAKFEDADILEKSVT